MSESQRPPIILPTDQTLTDAQWAAHQALLALEDGRYRLAAAFANLAHRAELAADADRDAAGGYVPVPIAGATRDEQPRATGAPACPHGYQCAAHDGVVRHVATGGECSYGMARALADGYLDQSHPLLWSDTEAAAGPFVEGPTGNGDRDLAATAAAAQTEVFPTSVPDSPARCETLITAHGITEPCRQGIYWRTGRIGDASTPAQSAGWLHIDPALDADHNATARWR